MKTLNLSQKIALTVITLIGVALLLTAWGKNLPFVL